MSKKPKEMFVTLRFEVPMDCWDDDVDWSEPDKVIKDQMERAGWEDTVSMMLVELVRIDSVYDRVLPERLKTEEEK